MTGDDRPEPDATPGERFLQTGRPLRDRAAGPPASGVTGAARKAAARALAPLRREWHEETADFEERLRDAVGFLLAQQEGEMAAREHLEEVVRGLSGQIDRLTAQAAADGEAIRQASAAANALGQRVTVLENRLREGLPPAAPAAPPGGDGASAGSGIPAVVDFDYLGFENRFRGSEELVRDRQTRHAERFSGPDEVADLGCGRGEFLGLLEARGIPAIGVDASPQMVDQARRQGFRAEQGDMFAWLEAREPGSLGGIMCSHVVEHLWPADHMRFARLAAAALRPGGVVVVETPNPKSLLAGAVNFPCDPTHLRPVFPETLQFMLEGAGFVETEVEYLSRVPDERRAPRVTGAPEELGDVVAQINEAIARLDDLVFGEMDYAVIARRGPA
jgi:SAM-dependent methyltransferase